MLSIYNLFKSKLKFINIIIFCLFVNLIFGLISFNTTSALLGVPEKSRGLTLSPLRSELEVAPGTSQEGLLTVTNSSSDPMNVNVSSEEFNVINQQYDYSFTVESNVAKWVSFSSSDLNLKPGESKKVKFSVGVPLSAEPGGRYISLFASTDTGQHVQGVRSRQRIASLMYITVLGDVTRSGNLIGLSSPWLISEKSDWSATLQNTGTTHYRSRYSVSTQDLFGNDVANKTIGSALILPGTIRLIDDRLPMPIFPGIYKITYAIGLGDTPAKTEIRLIIYMPAWATMTITIIITVSMLTMLKKLSRKKAS